MSDHVTAAAYNVSIKEQNPNIDDPIKAIAFALEQDSQDCYQFLSAWQSGDWGEIAYCFPEFLALTSVQDK